MGKENTTFQINSITEDSLSIISSKERAHTQIWKKIASIKVSLSKTFIMAKVNSRKIITNTTEHGIKESKKEKESKSLESLQDTKGSFATTSGMAKVSWRMRLVDTRALSSTVNSSDRESLPMKMEISTKASLWIWKSKVTVLTSLLRIAPSTRGNGKTTKEWEGVSILSKMVDITMVSGLMGRGQDMV